MSVCVVQTSELLRDLCMQNMARRYRLALSTERRQQVLVRPSVRRLYTRLVTGTFKVPSVL